MSRPSYSIIIALLGALAGLTPLAIDMYLPAIPTLASDFAVPVEQVQFSVSVYLIGFSVGQIFYGPATDSVGRMPILWLGIGLFVLGSLVCAFSGSLDQLLLGRLLQALGGAGGSVVLMGMMRDLFAGDEFARAVSFTMLVMALAPLAAPLLGGYLLLALGWRSLFFLLALMGAVLLVALWRTLGETLPKEGRPPLGIRSALSGYRQILGHRTCMAYLLMGVFSSCALFSFITGAPFVYIEYFQVAPQHFGYLFGLNVLTMMAVTSLNARYVARLGTQRMLRYGLGMSTTGALLLVSLHLVGVDQLWAIVVPVMLIFGPIGLISANSTSQALQQLPRISGSVAALGGCLRFAGGALAGGLVSLAHSGTPLPLVLAMTLSTLAAFATFVLQRRASIEHTET
ncbi:Bcr/CflA family multidrug efflux MFS transporter [Ferrimonas marina]|uniref:Bcr/CflA family efflux transporter n=1 Tax=Ferrimonas marina TaxID=299255 RepID=A0A1M5ZG54_9GAMM|nr:Bcr/CflA family multidrug efflux MFS transporter [Ferrimonas marina]SHI23245.1 MFS transporter, DHA1 family, bicyclomycin/chloramphenicol resistance protein [Ferrimonas marina]